MSIEELSTKLSYLVDDLFAHHGKFIIVGNNEAINCLCSNEYISRTEFTDTLKNYFPGLLFKDKPIYFDFISEPWPVRGHVCRLITHIKVYDKQTNQLLINYSVCDSKSCLF
jgi:hypothetical protein